MSQQDALSSSSVKLAKYQPLMELGSGGMGQVHLALSRGPRGFLKLVVLKTLKPELRGQSATYRMFLEEARISARLSHSNLVQTYEVIERDDDPTIVLEYVEGQTLASILEQPGQNLDRDMYLTILTKVLAGLHAAHELRDFDGSPLQLVHRDISPQNVMLQFDGQVKVLDFGIAKTDRSRVATETGILKGKIRYMAPEQLTGDELDRRVDVFAVGIMLWEALAKSRLWGDMTDGDIMRGLLNDSIPALPATAAASEELKHICNRALQTDRTKRYQNAGDLLRALEEYLNRQGSLCSAERLGGYLAERFQAERQRTQQIINAHIEALEDSIHPPSLHRSTDKTQVDISGQRPTLTRERRDAPEGAPPAREHSRRLALTVSAGAVLSALALSWWLMRPTTHNAKATNAAVEGRAAPLAVEPCAPNQKACRGQCVAMDRPEFDCGSVHCQQCQIPNATPRCNQRNECDVAVCYQSYDNCDGNNSNGCETNVRIDPDHCGGCGRRCPELPHAKRGCGDVCTIWRCDPNYRDCNELVADGCEVAVASDRLNCGHCGVVCPGNSSCREGKCR